MKLVWQGILKAFNSLDWPLLILLSLMAVLGLTVMHSAVGSTDWRFAEQSKHFLVAFVIMWVVACIPPPWIMRLAPYVYVLALMLLLGVEFFGETSKGATRWLNLGFTRIQPSEMLKITVPITLAWYFHRRQNTYLGFVDFIVAALLLAIPFMLIVRQPDLGTALLVLAAGFFVMYFAGLPFKLLVSATLLLLIGLGLILYYEDTLCAPDFDWVVLRDYQKHRVCTLLNLA